MEKHIMAGKRVNTATLVRGEVYTYRHPDSTPQKPIDSLRFTYGVPVVIEEVKILEILEDLCDETADGEGEIYEKPRFRIDRGVASPVPDNNRRPTRLDSGRSVKKKPIRRRA